MRDRYNNAHAQLSQASRVEAEEIIGFGVQEVAACGISDSHQREVLLAADEALRAPLLRISQLLPGWISCGSRCNSLRSLSAASTPCLRHCAIESYELEDDRRSGNKSAGSLKSIWCSARFGFDGRRADTASRGSVRGGQDRYGSPPATLPSVSPGRQIRSFEGRNGARTQNQLRAKSPMRGPWLARLKTQRCLPSPALDDKPDHDAEHDDAQDEG
jgi:hypothetical protein